MTMIRSVVVSMLRQGLRYLRLHRRHGRSFAPPLQWLVWAIAWRVPGRHQRLPAINMAINSPMTHPPGQSCRTPQRQP
jgi:hypothetical protein